MECSQADQAKGYSKCRLDILQEVLLKIGFSAQRINSVYPCFSSASFVFLIHGDHSELFKAFRGPQERLSSLPIPFTILMESLGRTSIKDIDESLTKGVKTSKFPLLSHSKFADVEYLSISRS